MHPQPATLVCTNVEFALLAGLAGVNTLVGVPDPFAGWLVVEVEEAWAQARETLAARGLVTIHPDSAVTLAPSIVDIFTTCGFPRAILTVTRTEPNRPPVMHHIHIGDGRSTHLYVSPDGTCEITMLPAQFAIPELVLNVVLPWSVAGPAVPAGTVAEAALKQAAAAGGDPAPLTAAGLEAATAGALAETLAHPVANCAVLLTSQHNGAWTAAGFGTLEGENGLWLLRAVPGTDGTSVTCEPCTAANLEAETIQLLGPVLSESAPVGHS